MTDLLLHKRVGAALEKIAASPPHGLLLAGEVGVGLGTIANRLAERLSDNPHTVRVITPDEKGTIAIETVRELYAATRSRQASRTVVVIDDADSLSQPAQNALLKLLEEPTEATMFILTSHQPLLLLPTVRSRMQFIDVVPITASASERLLDNLGVADPVLRRQLLFLAAGRPALLSRLASNSSLQQQYLGYAKSAKEFIGGTAYERVVISAKVANDRTAAMTMIRVALDMISLRLRQQQDAKLLALAESMMLAYERIAANGNVKAQLLNISV